MHTHTHSVFKNEGGESSENFKKNGKEVGVQDRKR